MRRIIANNFNILKGEFKWPLLISIIALLICCLFILVPMWFGKVDTKMDKAIFDIKSFQKALEIYKQRHGNYPSSEEGLEKLILHSQLESQIPTLPSLKDPWGNFYQYQHPGIINHESYDIWSYGADGKPGRLNEDSIIGNW